MGNLIEKLKMESIRVEQEADADHAKANPGSEETVQWVYSKLSFEGCDNLIYAAGIKEGIAIALLAIHENV